MGGGFSPVPIQPSPFSQMMGVAGMAMQAPNAMPGSSQATQNAQNISMSVAGLLMSPQTPVLGQAFQNVQGQNEFQGQLGQNFNFARPGGFGFNQAQSSGMSKFVANQANQNPFWTQGEMLKLASGGMQMGMFNAVRDVTQFQTQFRQMLKAVEQVSKVLGGSLEEAQQTMAKYRSAGVFNTTTQVGLTRNLAGMAAGSGVTVGQLQDFGGQIAGALRPYGVRASQGMKAGAQILGTVGRAQQMGILSDEALWQATGATGIEGQQAMAMRITQGGMRFMQKGRGKISMAAFMDPTTGEVDKDAMDRFMSGNMENSELQQRAGQNASKMGYARWNIMSRQFKGKFLGASQGMGEMMILRNAFKGKWNDPVMGLQILKRFGGYSQEEAEALLPMMETLPQIMKDQEKSSKAVADQEAKRVQWEQRSPGRKMAELQQKIRTSTVGNVEKILNSFTDSITTAITGRMDEITGAVEGQLSGANQSWAGGLVTSGTAGSKLQSLLAASKSLGAMPTTSTAGAAGFGRGNMNVKSAMLSMGRLGTAIGGGIGGVQAWASASAASMGGTGPLGIKYNQDFMNSLGIGKVQLFDSATKAREAQARLGTGKDTVVDGVYKRGTKSQLIPLPNGSFAIATGDTTNMERIAAYQTGNIDLAKFGGVAAQMVYEGLSSKTGIRGDLGAKIAEGQGITGPGLMEFTKDLIRTNQYKAGQAKGKPLGEQQVSAMATKLLSEVGFKGGLFGKDLTGLSAGKLVADARMSVKSLVGMGVGGTEAAWTALLQDPEYAASIQQMATGDARKALVDIQTKASAKGDYATMGLASNLKRSSPDTRKLAASASMGLQAASIATAIQDGFGTYAAELKKMSVTDPFMAKLNTKGMQAIAMGQPLISGNASDEFLKSIRQTVLNETPEQLQARIKKMQPDAPETAALLASIAGAYKSYRGRKGDVAAATQLADLLMIGDKKKRYGFIGNIINKKDLGQAYKQKMGELSNIIDVGEHRDDPSAIALWNKIGGGNPMPIIEDIDQAKKEQARLRLTGSAALGDKAAKLELAEQGQNKKYEEARKTMGAQEMKFDDPTKTIFKNLGDAVVTLNQKLSEPGNFSPAERFVG